MSDEIQRETMDVDVLIVGGGSAGLSAAYHLKSLIDARNAAIAKGNEDGSAAGKVEGTEIADPMIVVLEKGMEVGAHSFSGAVLKPTALKEMIPDYREQGFPIESDVLEDAVYYLTEKGATKAPITPPQFQNHGNHIISLSKANRWLAEQCEAKGINIFPGFAAVEVLYDGDKVVGVRTGDKGVGKDGQPKANFEPGLILKSKITIFAEGTRGSLFKKHAKRLNLREGKEPEAFEEGVKEIIQMPPGTVKAGQVIHTTGWPLKKAIGGTFIYTIPGDKIIVGIVAYLDSKDPLLDPHRELQKLKTHPWMRKMLEGGKIIHYGGKTLPASGYFGMPKLSGDGWVVVGDSASMVDVQKLKGIHLSMKSGMLAAETALDVMIKGSGDAEVTKAYADKVENSFVGKELYRVRNFHQALAKGMVAGMPLIAFQEITGGRGLFDNMPIHKDSTTTKKVDEVWGAGGESRSENQLPTPDGVLFMDKLSSVYLTGSQHDEDSPNHLLLANGDICRTVCEPQYKSPCVPFCPASVYEMLPSTTEPEKKDLHINYTNCIHCKTCDIKCPFENIEWTVPEGGGGPRYTET